jgi:hypothetical protein
MAFPKGPLPSSGTCQTLATFQRPSRSVPFSPGTELDLTDPANGCNPCGIEFYCTAGAGTNVVIRLAGDSVDRTYPLIAGQTLTGLIVVVRAASTATGFVRGV